MKAEDSKLAPGAHDWAQSWRPPTITSHMRGVPPGPPPVARWEALLQDEQAPVQRLVRAIAATPPLRRLFRLPPRMAEADDSSLESREERVREIAATKLARRLERLLPTRAPAPPTLTSEQTPLPGPLLDREINRSLEVLRTMSFEDLQRRGWHVVPNHWAWPLNDVPFLRAHPELWLSRRMPADIDFDLDGQMELMQRIAAYAPELSDVPSGPDRSPGEFVWDNGSFGGGDAYSYYGIVRDLKPRRVVEVGAGSSTLVLSRALAANSGDASVTVIEPSPHWAVLGQLPKGWRVIPAVAQDADMGIFEELEAGDVLFYDGSHAVRTGSDVNWMFFEVLPRLAPGVWIHVHDIFWPGDYPVEWLLYEGFSWNEQYLLQAFLMNNPDYRVRLAVRMLWLDREQELAPLLPAGGNGGSVWIEKVA